MSEQDDQTMQATLRQVLADAKERLTQAEAVAQVVPRLRREIKALEKTLRNLDATSRPRRTTGGPTIKEAIISALEASGGYMEFEPNQMLGTIHSLVGGNRNSVQVELHRLDKAGRLTIVRGGEKNRPIGLRLNGLSAPHATINL